MTYSAIALGVGVVVTVVGQGVPVVRREGDDPHDGSTLMLSPGYSPSAVYTHTLPPTIRARPGRAEYTQDAALLNHARCRPWERSGNRCNGLVVADAPNSGTRCWR